MWIRHDLRKWSQSGVLPGRNQVGHVLASMDGSLVNFLSAIVIPAIRKTLRWNPQVSKHAAGRRLSGKLPVISADFSKRILLSIVQRCFTDL
jgi:hypothetical protein